MPHSVVYGICKNKCQVEVYSKEQTDSEIKKNIGGINLLNRVKGDHLIVETDHHSGAALTLHGKTFQNQYTGKNLLKYPYAYESQEMSGVVFTVNDDGSIHINGTNTSESPRYFILCAEYSNDIRSSILNKELRLTGLPPGTSFSMWMENYNGSSTAKDTGNGATFTFTNETGKYKICIVIPAKATVNNVTVKPMLRLASITDETFEKYVGGIPVPNTDNHQDVHGVVPSVKRIGKNLLDLSKCEFISCKYTDGKVVSSLSEGEYYATIRTNELNDLLMDNLGKKFTFSVDKGITDRRMTVIVMGTKSDGTTYQEVSGETGSNFITMTLSNLFTSISMLDLRWNRATQPQVDRTTSITDVQFEFGDATSYEPYSESLLSYNTSELFNGDVIDPFGKLTRKMKKFVLNGSESWTIGNGVRFVTRFNEIKPTDSYVVANVYSSHFKAIHASDAWSGAIGVAINTNYEICITPGPNVATDVATFKEWLKAQSDAGTPVTVVCELATPTEEQLTRTGDMILEPGLNQVFSVEEYAPEIEMQYSPDGYNVFDYIYMIGQ